MVTSRKKAGRAAMKKINFKTIRQVVAKFLLVLVILYCVSAITISDVISKPDNVFYTAVWLASIIIIAIVTAAIWQHKQNIPARRKNSRATSPSKKEGPEHSYKPLFITSLALIFAVPLAEFALLTINSWVSQSHGAVFPGMTMLAAPAGIILLIVATLLTLANK